MATYAYQFITQQGAVCGSQRVTNRDRMVRVLEEWAPKPDAFAVVLLIVGGSFKERTQLGELAVSDVFFNRRNALRFVNQLAVEEQQQ